MPKTGNRVVLNLLRAFGVVGAGDDLRVPLAGAVSPIVDVEDFDPSPMYGSNVLSPLVAGQFSWVEVQARPFARLIAYSPAIFTVTVSRIAAFTPGGVEVAGDLAFPFRSDGSLPRARVQVGAAAVSQVGFPLGTTMPFPPVKPVHWDGVIHIESSLVAAAFPFAFIMQEHSVST